MTGFFTTPQVAWGDGAIEQLSGLGAARALVIVDPAVVKLGAHRRIVEELAKSETTVEVFSDIAIEPTVASVEPGVARASAFHPDWIVAVGGGSTIDSARAIWIRYAAPNLPLEQVTPIAELSLRGTTRFVAIPSTTGSGAEATFVCRLRTASGALLEASHRELLADWALLDPSLPMSLPATAVAETAADLIAHALEASVAEWSNPFSDALAREALSLALPSLPRAVRHPDDREAREHLQWAATMAGLAEANAQSGIAHSLAHALGGSFRVPHARLVAAVLPFTLEFNYPAAREKFLALGPTLGASTVQHRSALSEKLRTLWDQVGLPRSLAEAGVDPTEWGAARAGVIARAQSAPALVANPRIPSPEETGRLLDAAIAGTAVAF